MNEKQETQIRDEERQTKNEVMKKRKNDVCNGSISTQRWKTHN